MEGLIHRYLVKAIYLLPLFDPYSFSVGARRKMLESVASIVHNPKVRPNNWTIAKVSPAASACCQWLRAAYNYAQAASKVAPHHKLIEQIQYAVPKRLAVCEELGLEVQACTLALEDLTSRHVSAIQIRESCLKEKEGAENVLIEV